MPEPTIEAAREMIREALGGFVSDPPDSDFQAGYLECLYVIGTEALGMDFGPDRPKPPENAKPRPLLRVVK